jgi:hypothetical protein
MPLALALTPAEYQARIRAQNAERQARFKERQDRARALQAEQSEMWRAALERIAVAATIREARAIAADALGCPDPKPSPRSSAASA